VKEFIVYTAARFGVFAGVYGVVIGAYVLVAGTPVPVLWPLLVAAVVSTVLSAYLLRGMRDRFAAKVHQRAERMSQRFDHMRAKEDVD
jgi:mannitol-specific phosphotransferase system IIBC component